MAYGDSISDGNKGTNYPWQRAVLDLLKSIKNAVVSSSISSPMKVEGDISSGIPDIGNPVKIGGKASTSDPAAVTSGNRTNGLFDKIGRFVIAPYAIPENLIKGKTASMTNTADTEVIAAQGAGVKIYVTHILVTNGHASTGTYVNIKDGATSIYTGYAAAGGGGFTVPLPAPLALTENTALNAANETTSSDVRVSASGFKGA